MVDININNIFGTYYKVIIKIYLEDILIHQNIINGVEAMLKINYLEMIKQLGNDDRPIRLIMEIPKLQYSINENKDIEVIDYIEFKNKAMLDKEQFV